MEYYASVILPLALENFFTYSIPDELQGKVHKGMRVVVQFAKRKIYSALVVELHSFKPENIDIKPIISLIDSKPVVNDLQLNFWNWISEYYMCTIGEVFKAALPAGLKLESETFVIGNPEFNLFDDLTQKEILAHQIIDNKNAISVAELNSLLNIKNAYGIINSLMTKQAITIEEKLKEGYKPKKEAFLRLNSIYQSEEKLQELFKKLERAPKQLEFLMKFLQFTKLNLSEEIFVKKSELDSNGKNAAAIKSLIEKKIFEKELRKVSRLEIHNLQTTKPNILVDFQKNAYNSIIDSFKTKDVTLLFGVTSSGKTEIYIHLIQDYLSKGKQVLYLLPEIALTTQIINRLMGIFGSKVGVYHSKFNDSERVEVWNNLLDNNEKSYKIILGVRSSVFLPFQNLGLVIVDEEHETTYKQHDPAPRYNARDAGIFLAKMHNAKTLLGTATPSFEVYTKALNSKYAYVEIKKRFLNLKLPQTLVIDTRRAYKSNKMKSHFSQELLEHIQQSLKNDEQVILFQNRRGFSPYIECTSCGWIPRCNQCDVSLTYHKFLNNLSCHYCGYTISMVTNCPECSSNEVHTRGFGTEKIEDEISIYFPEAKIARMDLDSTRKKHAYQKIISDFEKHYVDILIGTQMITKGLDFDNVNLVGILNADNMINYPDFRAFERSYQLMSQVSGRAGRKKKQGKVIIQTSNPNHPVVQFVVNQNFHQFYNWQMKERERFHYPPYTRLITLTLKQKDKPQLNMNSRLLADELKRVFGKRVLGPEFPAVSKIQNWYIKNILIKIEVNKSAIKAKHIMQEIITNLSADIQFRRMQISYNVDPL